MPYSAGYIQCNHSCPIGEVPFEMIEVFIIYNATEVNLQPKKDFLLTKVYF
jgi:hypothetical protein